MASTAFASPALAKDDTWYVELNAGGMIVEDIDNLSGSNEIGTLDTKIGYDVGGIVGYDFGPFRLEAEASFRRGADTKAALPQSPARRRSPSTPSRRRHDHSAQM